MCIKLSSLVLTNMLNTHQTCQFFLSLFRPMINYIFRYLQFFKGIPIKIKLLFINQSGKDQNIKNQNVESTKVDQKFEKDQNVKSWI